MKQSYKDILIIIVVCSCIGLIRSLVIKDIAIIKTKPEIVSMIPETMFEPLMIDVDLSKDIFSQGAIFIDARDNEIYRNGHIENSINIPWDNIDENEIALKIEFIDFETPIVTYCSGGDCTLSLDLGDFLFYKLGYENVFIFEGGYPHWIEKNLPIKRFCSEKPTNNSINSECIYENE